MHDHSTDSSGVPWEGREFQPNPHAGDDGTTPRIVAEAITAFRDGDSVGLATVVNALAESRVLIPLVAHAGDDFDPDNPVMEDKVQELAVVTLAGPNGEKVFPAFTSVDAMRAWNRDARPIPIEMRRVCLAAAGEGVDRIVVNPGTDQIVLRRPVVWSIAQGQPVVMPWESADLLSSLRGLLEEIEHVREVRLTNADPTASGNGPELTIVLVLESGLDRAVLAALLGEARSRLSTLETLTSVVDSVEISLVAH